ncbi:hypothetical protein [Curtobacterium sp. MCSS17_016]|uniref:hypothetical protein n=1 Tax=Curtobacterium sp. MCSS17_016 TaxID=2175644 RepID=UPI000DAA386F|nr:hypothetical protein [Curtobacterium sp. MCSS17_016]WIE81351.1 hypothetical protein DEJ19_019140 [Curtobacterium sp. MCSS17_016]
MTTNTADRQHSANILTVELLPGVLFLTLDALAWGAGALGWEAAALALLFGAFGLLPTLLVGAAFAYLFKVAAAAAAPQTPLLLTLSWVRACTIAGGYALVGLMLASTELISKPLAAVSHCALIVGCITHIVAVLLDRRAARA